MAPWNAVANTADIVAVTSAWLAGTRWASVARALAEPL